MGPESSSEYFDVNGTIESVNTTRYLNIGSDTTSYKTVTFGNSSSTTAWALEGDTIITSAGSTWGRRKFPTVGYSSLPLARLEENAALTGHDRA